MISHIVRPYANLHKGLALTDISYQGIESVRTAFLNLSDTRLRRMLTIQDAAELCYIVTGKRIYNEPWAIARIREVVESGSDFSPPTCDCPNHTPEGLRWHKADLGEPVLVRYNPADEPQDGRSIWKRVFNHLSEVADIRFEWVDSSPDIDIFNEPVDGRGGTLGFAYQPASGDKMAACGGPCGDIVIDPEDFKHSGAAGAYFTVAVHEGKHATGSDHILDRRSIMYPSYLGYRSGMHAEDIIRYRKKYPY